MKAERTHPDELILGLVSISDRASRGVYEDQGLPALKAWFGRALKSRLQIHERLIADERAAIEATLIELVDDVGCDLVATTGRIVARDLTTRFGVQRPRIVVAGLNPHAGEEGALGAEDASIVAPAVRELQAEGINAVGPLPADTLFHERARAGYDVALCMYHDQALIPIKTLAFDHAVNVTLGLPFARTSPDHGTAFDIAGTGKADPSSLLAALSLAARLATAQPALTPAK